MRTGNLLGKDVTGALSKWAIAETPEAKFVPECHEAGREESGRLRYVAEIAEAFDLTKQAISQLSAFVLVAATGEKLAFDHPTVSAVRITLEEIDEMAAGVSPPLFARHNHEHLSRSLKIIRELVNRIERHRADGLGLVDHALPRLRSALQEINWAVAGLPGLSVVAFDQACGCHHVNFRMETGNV